jgi:7-carboxy-7-deazaguanine synthase
LSQFTTHTISANPDSDKALEKAPNQTSDLQGNLSVKEELERGTILPIMEAFYTLQGEGAHTGHAAWFIRTGGCEVGCHWCDVKDSWDKDAHPKRQITELVEDALKYPARLAVITGGEPLMHNLDPLTTALKKAGFRTHIETSGSSPISGSWDWITFSPKKFKAPLPEVTILADELKVVVFHSSDIKWAMEHAKATKPGCKLMLQPEWSKRDKITPLIIDHIKAHPEWSISLQTHKYLDIP